MNYKIEIENLIKELNQNKYIEVVDCLLGDPAEEEMINMLLNMYGIKEIPKELMEIYMTVGIFEIYWKCDLTKVDFKPFLNDDDDEVTGKIKIHPVENLLMLDDRLNSEVFTGDFTKDEKEDIKNFRVFDYNDDYTTFGLFVEEDKVKNELYYIQQNSDGFSKSEMNLENYFNQMIKNKGIIGWQYNMIHSKTQASKRMNYYIEEIFK